MERTNAVTMKGSGLTLMGQELKVGEKAPDFTVLNKDLEPVKLSDTRGKPRLFSVVPSLDTTTCSTQTKTFNERLAEMAGNVKTYTISADLPFAQNRFEQDNKIGNMEMLSDYKDMDFGQNYGLMMKELRLLSRAVIVVDKDDTIRHMEIVPEVSEEPNYDKALSVLEELSQ